MLLYVVRWVAWIATTLVVLSVLIFAITQMAPGNVANILAGQFATPDSVAAIAAKLGLNDPYYVQYWRWASAVLHGDFGHSLIMERAIAPVLWEALLNSAVLACVAFVVVVIVGIGLGVLAAIRAGGALDHG